MSIDGCSSSDVELEILPQSKTVLHSEKAARDRMDAYTAIGLDGASGGSNVRRGVDGKSSEKVDISASVESKSKKSAPPSPGSKQVMSKRAPSKDYTASSGKSYTTRKKLVIACSSDVEEED